MNNELPASQVMTVGAIELHLPKVFWEELNNL